MSQGKFLVSFIFVFAATLAVHAGDGEFTFPERRTADLNCVFQFHPRESHWKYRYFNSEVPRLSISAVASDVVLAANGTTESTRFMSDRFDIDLLMRDFAITRLQALELQALYRYEFRAGLPSDTEFNDLLNKVRAGKSLSGLDPKRLASYRNVIVLDVDGTILDQDSSAWVQGLTTFSYRIDLGQERHVAMAPGWDAFLRDLKSRGLGIVLYSRNSDFLVRGLTELIQIDGVSLKDYVDGVMTSSHMVEVQVPQRSGPNLSYYYKDLRAIDPTLEKVLIVDDNPSWIRPEDMSRTRYVSEFSVDKFFQGPSSKSDAPGKAPAVVRPDPQYLGFVRGLYREQFQEIVDEVDSALHGGTTGRSFTSAYQRYSFERQRELVEALHWLRNIAPLNVGDEIMGESKWAPIVGYSRARRDSALRGRILEVYRSGSVK